MGSFTKQLEEVAALHSHVIDTNVVQFRNRAPSARNAAAPGARSASGPATMEDELFHVTCPYCGEALEIYVERDVRGQFVQDCEVCCNPWLVRVTSDAGERWVDVSRNDGSE